MLFRADVSGVGTLFNDIAFNHLQNFVNINLTRSFLCAQNGFRMLKDQQLHIACGQTDIGDALTESCARMVKGDPQAGSEIAIEPMMDAR